MAANARQRFTFSSSEAIWAASGSFDTLGNGSFRLRCSGIPGRAYAIQFSNGLGSPVWQPLAGGTADARGVFTHIDTPPVGTRFYRTTFP